MLLGYLSKKIAAFEPYRIDQVCVVAE